MGKLDRVFERYEEGIRRLGQAAAADENLSAPDRDRLKLLDRLLIDLVRSYSAHHVAAGPALHASTSVMYAATEGGKGVLNVPIRSLVDSATLSSWQARYLNGTLGMHRTVVIAGPEGAGKSTLANTLLQLIPVDQRVVAIEDHQDLPLLRDRSFTVRLGAGDDPQGRANTIEKGGGMRPTWLIVDELRRSDAPTFFEIVDGTTAGLALVATPDAELALRDWTATDGRLASLLARVSPLIVAMDRDRGGRPKVVGLMEISFESGDLKLTRRRP